MKKIQNVMTRTRFQSILQNLHISNNDNDKTEKSYKIRPAIEHLNKVFAESLSNSPFQNVDEHMCKFKGRSSMKQYIKNKPIKWSFKYWYRCYSEISYVQRAKDEKIIEFSFECGTRLMPSSERYLLSLVL